MCVYIEVIHRIQDADVGACVFSDWSTFGENLSSPFLTLLILVFFDHCSIFCGCRCVVFTNWATRFHNIFAYGLVENLH